MSDDISAIITDPKDHERIRSIDCPNSYYAYPRINPIAPIPSHIHSVLDNLWSRSVHDGQTVTFYRFTDVVVALEGLVFDTSGRLIHCTRTYHPVEDILQAHRRVGEFLANGSPRRLGKGILAKSRGAENYGHFVLEMLPRAWLARHKLGLHDWPAVIYDRPLHISARSTDALQVAGFSSDQILVAGPEPVLFDELIFVDGLTSHTLYLSPFVMQCLDTISAAVPAGPHKRLYVPRRPAVQRDFANEAEVARRLRGAGFHEAETTTMSFAEQIAAFKGAEVVAGVMGAALTNLAFCRPGTDVFSFMPSGAAEVLFWMIAEAKRLRYHEIRCPEVGPQRGGLPWDRLLGISPRRVERIVATAFRDDARQSVTKRWLDRIAPNRGGRALGA